MELTKLHTLLNSSNEFRNGDWDTISELRNIAGYYIVNSQLYVREMLQKVLESSGVDAMEIQKLFHPADPEQDLNYLAAAFIELDILLKERLDKTIKPAL